jgi:RNA polymerase sigma-70 factor (ECF subfamily)
VKAKANEGGGGERPASATARFEELYDAHYSAVVVYVQRRVRHDRVDDVVAETFLTAWRSIESVPHGEAARWWLYRVAYRSVGHLWRGRTRRERLHARIAALPDAPPPPPELGIEHADELQCVLEAAAHLNKRDEEVLRLASWEHLTREQIAEVLDLTPNAVSQRLHRARANLTKEFHRLERGRHDRTPASKQGGTP